MEGALHGDHFTGISYVLVFVWVLVWVLWAGSMEWADSALFSNQPLFPLGSCDSSSGVWPSSCFSWMKRLHSHTQLVRLQQVN
jgi:hypothetical protein